MHGNNKSLDELRSAITEGVRYIVVDCDEELDRLEQLHAEGLPVPRVVLRITPGVHAHTHEYIATGQDDSKFGFNLGSGAAIDAVRPCRAVVGASSWSGCTATSARTCSRSTASPAPPR